MILNILVFALIGFLAGAIAGVLRVGHGHRITTYMIVGVIGALTGGLFATAFDLAFYGFRIAVVISLATATVMMLGYEAIVGEKANYHAPGSTLKDGNYTA